MANYELYHAGVKGMKWGVRKKSTAVGASKSKPKRKSRLDRQTEALRKDFDNIDKKYRKGSIANELAKGSKLRTQYGKRIVKTALASIGVMAVGTVAGSIAKQKGQEAAYKAIKHVSRGALAATVAGGTVQYIREANRFQRAYYDNKRKQ